MNEQWVLKSRHIELAGLAVQRRVDATLARTNRQSASPARGRKLFL
jgi:hypothetical protein